MVGSIAALTLALSLAAPGGLFSRPAQPQPQPHAHHHHAQAPAVSSYPDTGYAQHGPGCSACQPGGRIVGPGPGYGWGFANGNPDGYGWVDYGDALPLGANRTTDYFFRRHNAILPQQVFLPTYYNPYIQRGQRYIPYAGCGGDHPFGGQPMGTAYTPPASAAAGSMAPPSSTPVFSGEVEGQPAPAAASPSR